MCALLKNPLEAIAILDDRQGTACADERGKPFRTERGPCPTSRPLAAGRDHGTGEEAVARKPRPAGPEPGHACPPTAPQMRSARVKLHRNDSLQPRRGEPEEIGTVLPETSRTRVAVVKLFPPGVARPSGESLTLDATTSRNPRPTRHGQPHIELPRNQRELP